MKSSGYPIFINALKFNLAIACLLLLCLTTINTAVFAEDKPSLNEARFAVLSLNVPHAVEIYSTLAKTSGDANVLSEYAYALALAGFYEPAFIYLDRARFLAPQDLSVRYFASQIFALMNNKELASELWPVSLQSSAPEWIRSQADNLSQRYKRPLGPFSTTQSSSEELAKQFVLANALAADGFSYQSVYAFQNFIAVFPDDYIPRIGYSMAFEQIGALNMAARQMDKALSLSEISADAETKVQIKQRLEGLKRKSEFGFQNEIQKPDVGNISRRGNNLLYTGGQFASGNGSSYGYFNGRLGKYYSDNFDLALNTNYGWGGGPGVLSLGISERWDMIRFGQKSLVSGASFQTGLGENSSKSLTLSLGVTNRITKNGSIDFFGDLTFSGSNTVGLSLGFTNYFGMGD